MCMHIVFGNNSCQDERIKTIKHIDKNAGALYNKMRNIVHIFGDNAMINMVKEYRKEKNMTQEELASVAGISRKYLSMIERKKTTPSIDVVVRLASGLSVNVERLFFSVPINLEKKLPQKIRFIDLFCGIGGFRYA